MRGELIHHEKTIDNDGSIIEVKMWRVEPLPDRPHGYKYSLVYVVKGKRVIGYDNAEGKGDHRHYGEKVEPYKFKSLRTLARDFYRDMKRHKEGKL